MLSIVLGKHDDIIYLHQSHPPPYSRENDVERALKCGWCLVEPKRHPLIPTRANVTVESRLIPISISDRDLPVPQKAIEHREYLCIAQAFNAVLHFRYRICIRNCRFV